jgi:hypothetical protein
MHVYMFRVVDVTAFNNPHLVLMLQAQELQGSLGAAQSEVAGLRSAVEEAGARAAAAERDVARLRGARNEAQVGRL